MRPIGIITILAAAALAGCGGDGLSTAEAERAAEQRVRERFNLPADAPLETEVFVGREREGEPTVCGTVTGAGPDGRPLPPQRFIAAIEPARWLLFGETDSPGRIVHPDMFPDWTRFCAGAEGAS